MRLRFWNSRKSSTLVMMEGCLDRPKTSAPSRKTRVATYWFAPLIKLTTAITEVTPMTTPIRVSTLRSLCAHKLDVAIDTASVRCMVDARGIEVGARLTSYYTQGRRRNIAESSLQHAVATARRFTSPQNAIRLDLFPARGLYLLDHVARSRRHRP